MMGLRQDEKGSTGGTERADRWQPVAIWKARSQAAYVKKAKCHPRGPKQFQQQPWEAPKVTGLKRQKTCSPCN